MGQVELLVSKLKVGDEEAFAELYAEFSSDLLRHLYYLSGTREAAEDLLHEVMMLMIQKINFYSPRPELKNSFKSWLFRLATNLAIDELRKKKKYVPELELEVLADGNQEQAELYENKEREKRLGELLLQLPLLQRMVLSLRVHEDLSYQEISVICGRDINTVKQGLFQARKTLKNLLEAQGEWV